MYVSGSCNLHSLPHQIFFYLLPECKFCCAGRGCAAVVRDVRDTTPITLHRQSYIAVFHGSIFWMIVIHSIDSFD